MRESITEPLGGSTSRGEESPWGDRIYPNAADPGTQNDPLRAEAKRGRRIKTPEFLMVPHAVLRHEELNATDALALAALAYRQQRGLSLDVGTLSEWCGWSRWTSQRALKKLQHLDLLAEDGGLRPELFADVAGKVRVPLKDVQSHGVLEAIALALLRTWRDLGIVKRVGRWVEVPADLLSKFLGVCEKTARQVLQRLLSGQTVRVRRLIRRGAAVVVCGLLELQRRVGRAPLVSLLLGRRKPAEKVVRRQTEEPPTEQAHVDEKLAERADEALAAVRRGEFRGRSRPS